MQGDEVIRLSKQLAFFVQAFADEFDIDLSETNIDIGAEGVTVASINAKQLVDRAKSLQYGSISEED